MTDVSRENLLRLADLVEGLWVPQEQAETVAAVAAALRALAPVEDRLLLVEISIDPERRRTLKLAGGGAAVLEATIRFAAGHAPSVEVGQDVAVAVTPGRWPSGV